METISLGWTKRRTTVSDHLRHDEDNQKLYEKIVELLIAAGYFRARIQNMEPFDKILGGITWLLTGSFCDVDIEFKDDMNLSEKIKVSEKITAALSSVKCPYILNPVQLQGLDLNSIYQVLQWLVKKLIETRDERNSKNKITANAYYDNLLCNLVGKNFEKNELNFQNFGLNKIKQSKFLSQELLSRNENRAKLDKNEENKIKEEAEFEENHKIRDYVSTQEKNIEAKYNLFYKGRAFRPLNNYNFSYNDPLRIYFNLIEYGMNKDITFQKNLIELLKKKGIVEDNSKDKDSKKITPSLDINKNKDQGGVLSNKSQEKEEQNGDISTDEKKKLEDILTSKIVEVGNSANKINNSIIEEIFSENIDVIVEEIEKYENLKEDENFDKIKYLNKEKERLMSNKNNLDFQITDYQNELLIVKSQVDSELEILKKIDIEIDNLRKIFINNEENFTKLNEKIKKAKISTEKMELIGEKIKQRDELKENISRFKRECLEEKQNLENKIENFEKKTEKMNNEDNSQVFEEIDKNYNLEYEKLLDKKKDLFEQNKIINLLTRKIQVFPSKHELIQYQKRFQELYDQINNVLDKLKNLLNEVNSKEEVKKLLNQKLEVFLQLKDCFKNTKTKKDKDNFKTNLVNVLESLDEMIIRSNDKLKELNKNVENCKAKLNELQLYENKYMKLIKEYNKEFNKSNKVYV